MLRCPRAANVARLLLQRNKNLGAKSGPPGEAMRNISGRNFSSRAAVQAFPGPEHDHGHCSAQAIARPGDAMPGGGHMVIASLVDGNVHVNNRREVVFSAQLDSDLDHDGKSEFVEDSLTMLELIHKRWLIVLRSMKSADFLRRLNHPEWDTPPDLDAMLAMYSWHGKHHVAHVTELRKRESW